jgi:hypothetical protein
MYRFAGYRKTWAVVSLSAVMAAAAVPARADRQPNTTVGATERSAYQTAIDEATPEALRRYLDSYPDSPKAAQLLQMLIQACSQRLQGQGAAGAQGTPTGNSYAADACDLSELIAPAAGPGTTVQGFADPPTENSGGGRASPQ